MNLCPYVRGALLNYLPDRREILGSCSTCPRAGLCEIKLLKTHLVIIVHRFKFLMLTLWEISLFTKI